ncbi:MAG: hypothetical protein ACXAEN_23390 [Candidatus Thorarchaeota archaeon]|jgi:hypothetical protein
MAHAKEEYTIEKLQEMNEVMEGIVRNPDYDLFLSNNEDISVIARNSLIKKYCAEFHDKPDDDREKILAGRLLCTLFLMSDFQLSKSMEDYQGGLKVMMDEYDPDEDKKRYPSLNIPESGDEGDNEEEKEWGDVIDALEAIV